jgi:hypothetical protein
MRLSSRSHFSVARAVGTLVVAFVLLLASACGNLSAHSERAAWKAVVAHINARTPPAMSVKLTKEACRILDAQTIEIDLVAAVSSGFESEAGELTATVRRHGENWEVDDIWQK